MSVDVTRAFRDAVRSDPLELDRTVLLIAAHDHDVEVDTELLRLDALAAGVAERSLEGIAGHLFDDLGFAGDSVDYEAPRNSYLDIVLERRMGLPILLSILTMEVSRRLEVPVVGVGMPGHFIVRDGADPEHFVDPFAGGRRVDRDSLRERHHATGHAMPWSQSFLDPVTPVQIVARVLNNLMGTHRRRQRRRDAAMMASLATMLPGAGPRELLTHIGALAESGRFDRAARTAELLASRLDNDTGRKLRRAAERYRAQLN